MRVRLLAVDIDGTLLDSRKQISPRTRASLLAARDSGVQLVLVTGRRLPAARRIANTLWPGITLVLHNGALVVEQDHVIRCRPLPVDVARVAIEMAVDFGVDPVLHRGPDGEARLVVSRPDPGNAPLSAYLEHARGEVDHVADLVAALDEPPLEVMFGGRFCLLEPLYLRLCEALCGRARVERTVYGRNDLAILDVVHPSTGKAEAVAFLERRLGLTASQTLAIGDNWNDRQMLEAAGRGLVMGNAPPELLRLGFEVLPSNDDDGVAIGVERHVLANEKRG